MEVYALVGRSGTGKSYKAQTITGNYNINYMLDDGLLIKENKIIAGVSAKREKTKFAAVRRAVYTNVDHRNEICNAFSVYKPEKLLIIGTSEHMIQSIMRTLELGGKYSLIRIEDVSTQEEIELATKTRRVKGKHVIPVPTFEIKKAFSGYFIDSIKALVGRSEKMEEVYEKTVVRPTFSYLGSYEIKDSVIKSIVEASADEVDKVYKINAVDIENKKDGIIILITVSIKFKGHLPGIVSRMAEIIKVNVEYMTGINVLEINTIIKTLIMDTKA